MTAARRVQATRVYLAAAAVVGAALVFLATRALHPVYGLALAPLATIAVLWWWRGVFSSRRVVLWLEERVPALRFALAALMDAPDTRFRPVLEERVRSADFVRPLALAGLKLVGIPLALLLGILLVVRPLAARVATNPTAARILGVDRAPGGARADLRFAATITPPAYAGGRATRVENPTSVAALVGSGIRFTGAWSAETTMPPLPTVFRLQGRDGQRIVALEPRADSAPRVVLELPSRDTVLPVARGRIPLQASARDDIGIVSGQFEIIISSGSGESFKFRSATLGRAAANKARDLRLATTLDLDSLKLEPGDIVHLRALARDANPQPGAEAGSSDTRTLRVFRPGEADSSAIEAAPPPEVGKSELSQRMLIIMTEKLVAQIRRLSRDAVSKESGSIAQEQARLRKRVGQIIFHRLTGEEGDEDDAEQAMADTVDPGQALLRAAEAATNVETLVEEEGNDSPVIAVNRPLLEAFNAMWEAERRLGIIEPRQALPYMRAALDAIQKARAAERLYLRGRPPKIVLDIERIRLQGKKEGIDPRQRSPRASALSAQLERQARFHAALALLATQPAAAIDSLILVRVDVLMEQPRLAATLERVIDDLRSGRDATAALRASRRELSGAPVSGRATGWSGGGGW
jgi:hypothetical protein